MSATETELKKEFELERMILFSDAVFAIAITLLIIEIKFPEIEKGATNAEIIHAFKPVIIRFLGFILSFGFIGLMWSRHLKIFKYLRSYNNGVIFRNLVFLFFIVCFPFTASGYTEFIRPSFLLPIYMYLINVLCVFICQYVLCLYMFKTKPKLSTPGFEVEKNYILLQSKYSSLALFPVPLILILTYFYPQYSVQILYLIMLAPLITVITKKRLKKYKPVEEEV